MIQQIQSTKYSFILTLVAVFGLLFTSCDDSSTGSDEPESEIETNTVADLHAPNDNGTYVFYDLDSGTTVSDSASTDWDIAFSGTSVLTNSGTSGPGSGGAVVLDVAFDEVTMAPSSGFGVDSEEAAAITGWYNYTGQTGNPQHAILTLGKTIVLKTGDGNHYAKVEIMSYYQGSPDTSTEEFANFATRASSQYYTFQYAIQLEEGLRELE